MAWWIYTTMCICMKFINRHVSASFNIQRAFIYSQQVFFKIIQSFSKLIYEFCSLGRRREVKNRNRIRFIRDNQRRNSSVGSVAPSNANQIAENIPQQANNSFNLLQNEEPNQANSAVSNQHHHNSHSCVHLITSTHRTR